MKQKTISMQKSSELQRIESNTIRISEWFDQFIHSIKTDKLQLLTKTATQEKEELYHAMILNDKDKVMKTIYNEISQSNLKNLVVEFLTALYKNKHHLPYKIAFDFSNSKIHVWAVINDDDEKAEDNLIMSEAKANSKFADTGFSITSTIVEKSDSLKIPQQYKLLRVSH